MLTDGDAIAHGFVSAARAAVEAVEPSAVTSIGLLARGFILTRSPSRREYRAYLDMLESLDADELGVLRSVIGVLAPNSGVVHTQQTFLGAIVTWKTIDGRALGSGPAAAHVIEGLSEVIAARGGPAFPASGPNLPLDVVALLAEILQIEPGTEGEC